ncbi:hypothetical protein SRHO_G00107030 [Serrasalmus rhombeus]
MFLSRPFCLQKTKSARLSMRLLHFLRGTISMSLSCPQQPEAWGIPCHYLLCLHPPLGEPYYPPIGHYEWPGGPGYQPTGPGPHGANAKFVFPLIITMDFDTIMGIIMGFFTIVVIIASIARRSKMRPPDTLKHW